MLQVGVQHIALQGQAGKFALAADGDQAGSLQLLHVVGQSGGADGLTFANLSAGGAVSFGADLLQNLMASRIGQRLRDPVYLLLRKRFLLRHDAIPCSRM